MTKQSTTNVSMNQYWYLKHSNDQPIDSGLSDPTTWLVPLGMQSKLRPGHRIVLGSWDDTGRVGRVAAFAVCTSLRGTQATVNWSPADTALRPLPQGQRHWRTKDFFVFADSVIERYCLDDLFAEHLGDIVPVERKPMARPAGLGPVSLNNTVPGHIYILKSPYGYKIGKTVNLTERTRLFAVKLPFPNSLIHHFHVGDYTAAERALHIRYAAKRLEGEWFALSTRDLGEIRSQYPT